MKFQELALPGAYLIDMDVNSDNRGYFARTWCHDELAAKCLDTEVSQCSVSFNAKKGTLRGLHFQHAPHEETKIVRAVRGRIFDVIVDIRQGSPTFGKWVSAELSAENRRTIYVPKGFAHGFQTLEDDSELLYMMSAAYRPALQAGVLYNDPAIGIEWPLENPVMSDRDRTHPRLRELTK